MVGPIQYWNMYQVPSRVVCDKPEQQLMSVGRDAGGNFVLSSEVGPMCVVCLWNCGFEDVSIFVCDVCGDTVDDGAPVSACSVRSCPNEEDKNWKLGDIPLLWNADLPASLSVDFGAPQAECCQFNLYFIDKPVICLECHLKAFRGCRSLEKLGRVSWH